MFAGPTIGVQRFLGSGFILAVVGIAGLKAGTVVPPAPPEEPHPFAAQLYTRGWSQPLEVEAAPPAMQWRVAQAAAQGLEVLWWTDPRGLLDQSQDLVLPLDYGQVDPATLNVIRMPAGPDAVRILRAQVQGGKPRARLRDGWLEMSLTSDLETEEWQSFSYRPRSTAGKLQGFRLARPLASHPQWQMEVEVLPGAQTDADAGTPFPGRERPEEVARLGKEVAFEISVELSVHGQETPSLHHLTYRLIPAGAAETAPARVEEDAHVIIPVPLRRGVNVLTLDLAADARRLPDGEDNVISEVVVTVRARRGATAALRWRRPRLTSQRPEAEDLLEALRDHAARYERAYNVKQGVGGMYGQGHDPCLSAFLPPTRTVEPILLADQLSPAAWVTGVHEARGLVAYHLDWETGKLGNWETGKLGNWETGLRSRGNQAPLPNFPVSQFPLVSPDQRARALHLTTALLQTRAYGADLVAFAARSQGGLELPTQLAVWDVLLANDLVMGGVGVSRPTGVVIPSGPEAAPGERRETGLRSRGAGEWSQEPAFISWLWAPDQTAPELLAALRERRVFFGDPARWEGSFDLRLTDRFEQKEYGRMGQEVVAPGEEAFLHLDLEPPQRAVVRVIQGLLRPGRSVHYVRREVVADPTQALLLDTRPACFVRVEVWDDTGPMVCSNPLIIRKPQKMRQSLQEVKGER